MSKVLLILHYYVFQISWQLYPISMDLLLCTYCYFQTILYLRQHRTQLYRILHQVYILFYLL
nr:MAG TPA: hypothetical protein [Caudoviricetes sp.]